MQVKIWMASGPMVFGDDKYAIAVNLHAQDVAEIVKAHKRGAQVHCCAPPGHKLLRDQIQMQLFAMDGWADPPAKTKIITKGG